MRLDLLLKHNPVLTVSALQAPETVAGLVAAWNPAAAAESVGLADAADLANPANLADLAGQPSRSARTDLEAMAGSRTARMPQARGAGDRSQPTVHELPPVHPVGDGILWHGPIRLTPMLRADAGLPGTPTSSRGAATNRSAGGFAYVAEVARERTKVPDGRYAAELRRRYPQGMPTGAEAEAWRLVRGLAKRLRGVAHLPGSPAYVPHTDAEPLISEHDCRVYSHEMLPWIVLREILRPLAPDLSREPLPYGGYVLRQRGLLEVRVRPASAPASIHARTYASTHAGTDNRAGAVHRPTIPYAIRDRADDAWPHSVYEFCDLSRSDLVPAPPAQHLRPVLSPPRRVRIAAPVAPDPLRNAATLIAEVTGGVLLDTDGFPLPIRAVPTR